MGTAVVHYQEDLSTIHPVIKPFDPSQKNNLRHPCFGISKIFAAKVVLIQIFKASRLFRLSDNPQWNLISAITVTAYHSSDPFFAFLPPLQLPIGKGVVSLKYSICISREDLLGRGCN